MFPVVKYKDKIYGSWQKDIVYYSDWLGLLTDREKDIILVSKLIGSARLAAFPDKLTCEANYRDLEVIKPVLNRNGWNHLLEKIECIDGFSVTGEDFYVIKNETK